MAPSLPAQSDHAAHRLVHAASLSASSATDCLHGAPVGHAFTTFRSLRLLQESTMQYSESEINRVLVRLFRWGYGALTRKEREIVDMLSVVC